MNAVQVYIKQFEPDVQEKLNELRQFFFEVFSNSEQRIRYKIPTYKVGKHYLYFAACNNYIGFYSIYGLTEIKEEVVEYRLKKTKDSLYFMLDKPLPLYLVKKIIMMKSKL